MTDRLRLSVGIWDGERQIGGTALQINPADLRGGSVQVVADWFARRLVEELRRLLAKDDLMREVMAVVESVDDAGSDAP